jgi:LacI family transcriptional regulator
MADRLSGTDWLFADAGLKEHLLEIKFTSKTEKVAQLISNFLVKNKKIDAILFATNYLALQGFEAINRQGLKYR